MNIIKKSIFLSLISVFTIYDGHTQESIVKIKELITQKWALAHFPLNDISNFQITDQYTDENTGITYVYAQEYAGNIPIENAIANFAFKNNKAVVANLSPWVNNISEKLISASQVISASDAAITAIILSTGKSFLRSKPQIKIKISENHVLFEKPEQILDDVPAELVYKIDEHQKLILYWKVGVHDSSGKYWENFVNASSGNIDVRKNQTLACVSGHIHASKNYQPSLPFTQLVPQFRVWPIPLSAPNDGNPQLVSDPADKTASASGWNNDGTTPFKITKGNNVHAFSDPDSNYVSANDEPIGGDNLVFDYSYDPSGTIDKNKNAAIVNLFYMNNIMHDFSYYYGFDEKAGNFQKKNFTSSGKGNDWVIALGQYGYNNSRIRNNADFLPLPDGSNGRMRMFIWNVTGEKLLKIIDPVSIATDLETGSADFAPTIGTIPTKGKVAIVSDGSNTPTLGCKTLTNAAEVSGKIAVIDRGDCFFHQKACFAQAAGAIAVIIINFENAPNNMSGLSPAPCSVTIPVISVSSADGDIIRKNASTITLSIQKPLTNSNLERDGSFDNGVIAHEYGHGISTRLTGGPSNSGCLGNDEQMGEGWSDFMTLVTTAKPGATGNGLQGIGTYPIQQTTTDRGIRKYPYTTNFAVNGQTYESIFTTDTPHALGEIWTLMLWDLYWKMVAKYGWDADLYKGTGGNNKAIKLVFEGMRLQPCSPGFTDGRNAILAADKLLYNGDNQCLIWQAFAARGLGYSASQGSSNDRTDGIQAFDLPPTCIETVKVAKQMTPNIKAGDDITVTISVRNDTKVAAKNVIINDSIPDNCNFKTNSGSVDFQRDGNLLVYSLPADLLPGDTISFSYKLESSKTKHSTTFFIDSMENTEFDYDILSFEGSGIWELTDVLAHSGKKSWFVPDLGNDNDQILNPLKYFDISTLKQPVMRFFHKYKTQNVYDGGMVRLTSDVGKTYQDLGKNIFRNGYNGPLSYFTIPIPDLRAFYGDSKGFIPSYIDLRDYKNQKFLLQFRWGSDNATSSQGWFIDDLEIMDMVNYNSHVCVSFNGNQSVCAEAPAKGTIVESDLGVASKDAPLLPLAFSVAPNPANEYIHIRVQLPQAMDLTGNIFSIDGRQLKSFKLKKQTEAIKAKIDTDQLPAGMYIITLTGGRYSGQQKFVVEH